MTKIDPNLLAPKKVEIKKPLGGDGKLAENLMDDPPLDTTDLPFYFKLKPVDAPIKVKSSVVLPLPIYSSDALHKIKLSPAGGYSQHDDKPLSFEYIYNNFDPEDFAQLLVTSGVLSKAIRYALLYNYFGYPIANYSDGEGNYEMDNTGFAKYNNLAKRCLGTDQALLAQLHAPEGIIWSQENYETSLTQYLTDYVQGFYQFGEIGSLPSFNSSAWNQGTDETSSIEYFSPIKFSEAKEIIGEFPGYSLDSELSYEQPPSFSGLYNSLHGMAFPNEPSYVEPIGIDAQYAGISAYLGTALGDQPGNDYVDLRGSALNSLAFNPSWGAHTNNVHKTYARAWMPSDVLRGLGYFASTLDAFSNPDVDGIPDPHITLYGAGNSELTVDNSLWGQLTYSNFTKSGVGPFPFEKKAEHSIEFNSLAYVTGHPQSLPSMPSTEGVQLGGTIYHSFWNIQADQFKGWYHNLESYIKEPEDGFSPFWKNNWQSSNIVSMYKLVPAGLNTNAELNKYRNDPAKTLNVIWPKIWDYIERVAPRKMYQSEHITYGENIPGSDQGSKFNKSDIITSPYGSGPSSDYVAYDWTPKFRIGHQMTPTKAGVGQSPFGNPSVYDGPVPSSEQGGELGFTHVIGDSGDRGYHLIYAQDTIQDGLSQQYNQTGTQQRFRNKLSLNFKTDFHRGFFWDSKYDKSFGSTKGKFIDISYDQPIIQQGLFAEPPIPVISYKFSVDYSHAAALDVGFTPDNGSVSTPNPWEDELDYSYYLSTKMLTYLYLKAPAGFDSELPSVVPGTGFGKSAGHATSMLENVIKSSYKGSVMLPTSYGEEQFGQYLESSDFQEYLIPNYIFETYNEDDLGDLNDYVDSSHPAFTVTNKSNFALPVWYYQENTSWDPRDIEWSKISDSQKKIEQLEEAGTLEKYSGIENLTNYGLPSWVRSIRIYPCPDKQITATNPNAYGVSGIGWDVNVVPPQLPTDKDSEGQTVSGDGYGYYQYNDIKDVASAALKINLEPISNKCLDDQATEMNLNASLVMYKHVDVRYVVELDIDERELILTMAGQGVFQLDGTIDQYEDIGISLKDIIDKTFGNVSSEDIKEELDSGNYDFDLSGNGEIDFQNLPGAGIFPPSEVDEICALFAEPELLQKTFDIMEQNPANIADNDPWKCTSYLCLKEIGQPTYRLKKEPGKDAQNIGYLDDGTIVKVTKEWAIGKGEYHKVLIVDNSSPYFMEEGYIPPELLKPLFPNTQQNSKIFFNQIFDNLSLAESPKLEMSEMAKALIPNWWKMEEPYYHREDMEYWANVELPYDCVVDDQDLEAKKQEAVILGIEQLFNYYNVLYTDDDIKTLANTYLAARAEECYIDSRPGAPIKVLVKVGAIYLNAFPNQVKKLQDLKSSSAKILSLDSRHYQTHLQHAIFSLNKIYLDIFSSKFSVPGLDLEAEAQRLSYIPVGLKKMLAVNGYNTGDGDRQDIINLGFDENYALTFVSIIEDAGPSSSPDSTEEKLVTIGFDLYKNSEPFNFPNTMSLFFHHRELKNPVLKWQDVVEKWMISPTYEIVSKDEAGPLNLPSNSCGLKYFDLPPLTEIMMGIGEKIDLGLDLHPRYDLGAFQFNLLQFFPPCPKPAPGKGSPFYKMLSEIDGQTVDFSQMDFMEALEEESSRVQQYVGDWLASGAALRDIRGKIFDLDDLYLYVLNYITPEALYSKICKCFIDLMGIEGIPIPNLEISASGGSGGLNLDPNTLKNNPKNIYSGEGAKFNTNFVDKDGKLKNKDSFMETLAAEDLFCSFCFNIPSIFFRLPTTNLLDFLISALKAILEFALAQILLELIMALLDALLTCPEINCPSSQGGIKDYGAQSLAELAPNGVETYRECGIPIDGVNVTNESVSSMLEECSNSLTTSEVLGLLDGSATKETLKVIERVITKYPNISSQINTTAQLTTIFSCVGNKVGPDTLGDLGFEVTTLVNDKNLCQELIQTNEQAILDKCGNIPDALSMASKVLNPDFSKYADIARIIRENDDLSTQIPPLFSDGKGMQALLSGLKSDTADFALQEALETQAVTAESSLMQEVKQLFKAPTLMEQVAGVGNVYVKANEKFAYYKFNGAFNTWMTAVFDEGGSHENQLPKLNVLDGDPIPMSHIIRNISNSIKAPINPFVAELKAELTEDDYVHLTFGQPYDSDGDGSLDYNDSYSFVLNSQNGINLSISGNPSLLPPDMLEYLNKNDLESSGNCEQSQFLSYLILSNLNMDNIDQPLGSSADKLKEMLESQVYVSALSSGLTNMGNIVSKSKLLESYDIEFWNAVSATLAGPASLATLTFLPPIAAVLAAPGVAYSAYEVLQLLLPELKRQQLEKVNLISSNAPDSSGNIRRTFIDFDFGIELAKVEYDFSKYYDPNSPFIGMPHYAMLESVVSNMMQLFVGEALVRGVFILPFFPKEVFLNDDIANFVLAIFDSYLNTKAGGAGPKIRTTLMRMVYEKTEFTPNENSSKPLMPGETQDIDALVAGTLQPFGGKIYDASYGREYEINSWKDCALYFIRKNMERPLSYIKDKLTNTTLGGENQMDQEVNPFFLMVQKGMKEVHSYYDMTWMNTKPNNISSTLVQNDMIGVTKNGAFFVQYYFRIEDLSLGDDLYYEYLVQRKKVMISNVATGLIDGDDWSPPGSEEYLEDIFDDFSPVSEGEDGENNFEPYPWPGQKPNDFVGDPGAEEFLLISNPDLSLKSILNRDSLYRLWQAMSVLDNNTAKGNYAISKDDQAKTFASFFKSIKLGVRLCYVVGDSTEVNVETGVPIIDEGDVVKRQDVKDFTQNIIDLLQEDKQGSGNLSTYQQYEKMLLIEEKHIAGTDTSVILPLIEKEVDITNHDIFQNPVSSFSPGETGDELSAVITDPEIASKLNSLVVDMFSGIEGRTLFKYCLPIPKLATMLFMYNAIGLSTDDNINNAFDSTKEIIKQNFESIYDIKGPEAYKYQPQYIKDRGGTRGIAASASEQTDEE